MDEDEEGVSKILTAEQIAEQVEELRSCEGVGIRQRGLYDRFQDAATTIEALRRRAERAETETKGLRIQIDTMARIASAREKQFAKARAERDKFRAMAVKLADALSDVEYQELGEGRLDILKEPDIASLARGEKHNE